MTNEQQAIYLRTLVREFEQVIEKMEQSLIGLGMGEEVTPLIGNKPFKVVSELEPARRLQDRIDDDVKLLERPARDYRP